MGFKLRHERANFAREQLTISPERLERLRAICLALPAASEKQAWGDPTWRVENRIFAMQKGNYLGGRPSLWLKVAKEAQTMFVAAAPERFFVPPYVGHKGWVGIYLDGPIDMGELAYLVQTSYRLIAPRRLASQVAAQTQAVF